MLFYFNFLLNFTEFVEIRNLAFPLSLVFQIKKLMITVLTRPSRSNLLLKKLTLNGRTDDLKPQKNLTKSSRSLSQLLSPCSVLKPLGSLRQHLSPASLVVSLPSFRHSVAFLRISPYSISTMPPPSQRCHFPALPNV